MSDEKKSNLKPRLLPASSMTLMQCTEETKRLLKQIIIIHDLPKLPDGTKVQDYMHETLECLRNRCIELNWRSCEILSRSYKTKK